MKERFGKAGLVGGRAAIARQRIDPIDWQSTFTWGQENALLGVDGLPLKNIREKFQVQYNNQL